MDLYNLDKTASRILRTAAAWEKCSESDIVKKYIKIPANLMNMIEKTNYCSICGLPKQDHEPSKPGNIPRAGSCPFIEAQF